MRHTAILQTYLRGTRVLVEMDEQGRILDSNFIHTVWSGTQRFGDHFRELYNPVILYDNGEEFRAWIDTLPTIEA